VLCRSSLCAAMLKNQRFQRAKTLRADRATDCDSSQRICDFVSQCEHGGSRYYRPLGFGSLRDGDIREPSPNQ